MPVSKRTSIPNTAKESKKQNDGALFSTRQQLYQGQEWGVQRNGRALVVAEDVAEVAIFDGYL